MIPPLPQREQETQIRPLQDKEDVAGNEHEEDAENSNEKGKKKNYKPKEIKSEIKRALNLQGIIMFF